MNLSLHYLCIFILVILEFQKPSSGNVKEEQNLDFKLASFLFPEPLRPFPCTPVETHAECEALLLQTEL